MSPCGRTLPLAYSNAERLVFARKQSSRCQTAGKLLMTDTGHLVFCLNHQAHFLVTRKNVVDDPVLEEFLNGSAGVDISVI